MSKLLYCVSGVGFGHASRSLKIITELSKKHDVTVASYGEATHFFKKNNMETIELNGFTSHGNHGISVWETLSNEKTVFFKIAGDYLKLSKLDKQKNFDAVVSDSDPIGIITANFLKKKNIVIENIFSTINEVKYFPMRLKQELNYQIKILDDVNSFLNKHIDLFIQTGFEKSKLKYHKIKNIGLMIESKIDVEEYNRVKNNDFIVIPLPGTSTNYGVIKQLIDLAKKHPNQRFHFINFPTNTSKKLDNIVLYPLMSFEEVKSHIKASKAVITFAGFNTLTDVLFFNKPSLILPLANHVEQIGNANYFRRNKLAEVVFPKKEYEQEKIENGFNRLLNNLEEYSNNIKERKYDFEGINNAVSEINKAIK